MGDVCMCDLCQKCLELTFECNCEKSAAALDAKPQPTGPTPIVENVENHARAGFYWTAQELLLVKREFRSGATLTALASLLGRTEMAVMHRLISLGLVHSVDLEHALKRAQMRYLDIEHRVLFRRSEQKAEPFEPSP